MDERQPSQPAPVNQRYLGDGVYAEMEGGMIKLTTSDGVTATNTIFLEPEVYDALVAYGSSVRDARRF